MRSVLAIFCLILGSTLTIGAPIDTKNKAHYSSDEPVVAIKAGLYSGSGVAFHNDGHEFIWTAAHVIEGVEKIDVVIDPQTGKQKIIVSYDHASIIKEIQKNKKAVGRNIRYAEVIRYSDCENGLDLALLKTLKPMCKKGAKFSKEETPEVGQKVIHIGSPGGLEGYNSYIEGSVSFVGRPASGLNHNPLNPRLHMDQFNIATTGGSSGGPIFDTNFNILGLLTQGYRSQPSICFAVPTREIKKFAKETNCLWAVDKNVKVPSGDGYKLPCPRVSPIPKDYLP